MKKSNAPTADQYPNSYSLFPLPRMGISPELRRYLDTLKARQQRKDEGLRDLLATARTHLSVARMWHQAEGHGNAESTRHWASESVRASMRALLWETTGAKPKDAEREIYSKALRGYLAHLTTAEEAALAAPCTSREQAKKALDTAVSFLLHAQQAWRGGHE